MLASSTSELNQFESASIVRSFGLNAIADVSVAAAVSNEFEFRVSLGSVVGVAHADGNAGATICFSLFHYLVGCQQIVSE